MLIYIWGFLVFVIFPALANVIATRVYTPSHKKYLVGLGIFCLAHNLFFIFNYSIQGDYPDYIIFSLEYFLVCTYILLGYRARNPYIKAFGVLGLIFLGLTVIISCFSLIFLPVIAQDYISEKSYVFTYQNISYQTRCYSFSSVTSINTKHTLETYQNFRYLPIEFKIDKTIFSSLKHDFSLEDKSLQIKIVKNQLVFSTLKKVFTKQILLPH